MAEWNYKIAINNQLDRDLKLISSSVPWGKARTMPDKIKAKQNEVYNVYSPAGAPYGLEFYITLQDETPPGSANYGTIDIGVDMPYWKHDNTSYCNANGFLRVTGFQKVPDGNHDFQTSVTVYTAL